MNKTVTINCHIGTQRTVHYCRSGIAQRHTLLLDHNHHVSVRATMMMEEEEQHHPNVDVVIHDKEEHDDDDAGLLADEEEEDTTTTTTTTLPLSLMSHYPYQCRLELTFPRPIARELQQILQVDPEITTATVKVLSTRTNDDNNDHVVLVVEFYATHAKGLRVSISSCMDYLQVALKCYQEFHVPTTGG